MRATQSVSSGPQSRNPYLGSVIVFFELRLMQIDIPRCPAMHANEKTNKNTTKPPRTPESPMV